jgi:hypothetical protein
MFDPATMVSVSAVKWWIAGVVVASIALVLALGPFGVSGPPGRGTYAFRCPPPILSTFTNPFADQTIRVRGRPGAPVAVAPVLFRIRCGPAGARRLSAAGGSGVIAVILFWYGVHLARSKHFPNDAADV